MGRILLLSALLFGLLAGAQTEKCPCCTDNHKAFDFWIGTWKVTNADGTAAGENIIEKVQDSCILKENWTSAAGNFTGTSTNFYNLITKQWEQLWIDNSGRHLKLKGNRKGASMIMASDKFIHTDGNEYVNRITWTANEDGTVRQLWEVLKDEEVVNVAFNGLYKKVASK